MDQTFKVFKALADETRLAIALYLSGKEEVSCQELSKNFSLSQPTLSHHFKKLADAGIIIERKAGVSHFYKIDTSLLKNSGINLQQIKKERT